MLIVLLHHYKRLSHMISFFQCARKGTIIHTFNYTDDDHGVNAKVRFNISQLNDNITDIFKMMQNGSLQVVAGKLDSGQNGGRYQVIKFWIDKCSTYV